MARLGARKSLGVVRSGASKLIALTLSILIGAAVLAFTTPVTAAGLSKLSGGSAVLSNSEVTPFSVEADDGIWDYGTKPVMTWGGIKKKVWSYYWHPTRWHASSVRIGTLRVDSGCVPLNETSHASAIGPFDETGYAYYRFCN